MHRWQEEAVERLTFSKLQNSALQKRNIAEAGAEPLPIVCTLLFHAVFCLMQNLNSMKLVVPLQSLYWSIRTKDESKRGTAFAFIFGVN